MTTATASRPAVDAPAPHLPVAEVALVGVTTAAVVSFSRLFQDWSFFWPLMAVVAYSHLATLIMRRRGYGIVASAVVCTAGFVVLASWLWFASSTFFGIPEPSTWTAFTTLGARLVERVPRAHRAGTGAIRLPRRGSRGRLLRRVPGRLGCLPPVVTGRVADPRPDLVHLQHPARLRTTTDVLGVPLLRRVARVPARAPSRSTRELVGVAHRRHRTRQPVVVARRHRARPQWRCWAA